MSKTLQHEATLPILCWFQAMEGEDDNSGIPEAGVGGPHMRPWAPAMNHSRSY